MTVIENLEFYGIDPRVFAHAVQIAMACSATTVDSEQKNHGVNVVVQGNQMTFISKLLLGELLLLWTMVPTPFLHLFVTF